MQRSLILSLLLALVIVVFALQNSEPIPVKIFFWNFESSSAFVMTSFLFIGALLGVLFSIPSIRKKNEKIEELEEKILNKNEGIEE